MHRIFCLFIALSVLFGSAVSFAEVKIATRPDPNIEAVLDPPYDFDPDEMLPRDFGEYFTQDYLTETSQYPLLQDTEWENQVLVMKGQEEGPTLYIVAGVHGGEIAAWMTGNLVKKIGIKAGVLHILSPANPWGASRSPRTRYVTGKEDLNRSFPGDPNGDAAQRIADAIFTDITQVNPVFVFDLHEAATNIENRDFLGNSLIYTSLDKMNDLYLDILLESQLGMLTSVPFTFFSPGPKGSVNRTISELLNLPVITVETYRADPMEVRIANQLAIVQYVLQYYGLI